MRQRQLREPSFSSSVGGQPDSSEAAASKPFAFLAHHPSAGVGGDSIPVVPFFLDAAARGVGLDLQLVQASARIDQTMPRLIVDKLESALEAREQPRASKIHACAGACRVRARYAK